jgi:Thioredoxin
MRLAKRCGVSALWPVAFNTPLVLSLATLRRTASPKPFAMHRPARRIHAVANLHRMRLRQAFPVVISCAHGSSNGGDDAGGSEDVNDPEDVSSEMGSCKGDECVTSVASAEQLQQFISGDAAGDTIHVDERGRLRISPRLVILSVMRTDSLACGLVRPVLSQSCEKHKYETQFLEISTDDAWATAEAHKLGVKRLPTVIIFRNGKRVDHFSGREVRKDMEHIIFDNL